MLTNVYFVRHAHSIYTSDELARPLSTKGLADADRISHMFMFENERIDTIISSPYKRSIQTVEGIAKLTGKEIIINDGFKERTLTAKPVEDFNLAITKVWEQPTFSWEGGESNVVAQKRGVSALLRVLEIYEGKNIVIGTHGNIMVLMMNYFNEKYSFEFWKELGMPDIYKLTFDQQNLIEVNRILNRK